MFRITFIVPYAELKSVVEDYVAKHAPPELRFEMTHVVGVQDVKRLRLQADLVVARGITCAALRRFHPRVPTVEIQVTGYDVVTAVEECRRRYGADHLAIIGSQNMISGAQSLNQVLGASVKCYIVRSEDDAHAAIQKALDEGAEAVVGGLMVHEFASAAGIKSTMIRSGPDAIRQAVEEAIRTANVTVRERERAEFLKIVMDYTQEAIIAVDREGRVTAANKQAAGLFPVPGGAPLVGKSFKAVFPNSGLARVLQSGEEILGAVEQFGDTMIAANLVPMRVGGEAVGAVATFQNATRIQEVEGRIRQTIHRKGLVAKYGFADIVAVSKAMEAVIEAARRYAKIDANVLITGETGTGKELFAHALHSSSGRGAGPFVAVNCAALPDALLESELFGYAEGAFTGAVRGGKAGLFELAHRGTLFLDEIGEITPQLQAKLLRVLQEKEIMRVGDDRVIPIDVRVVAATNHDLRRRAAAGAFRHDLLFRLDVLRVHIPPLRSRREDILPLAAHFLATFCGRFGSRIRLIRPEARAVLAAYPWPGNVRELANVCERIAALVEGDTVEEADVLALVDFEVSVGCGEPIGNQPGPSASARLADQERELIRDSLVRNEYNRTKAARELGISRSTLWRKWKEADPRAPRAPEPGGGSP